MTLHERFSCCVFFVAQKYIVNQHPVKNNDERDQRPKTAYCPVRSQKDRQDYAHKADHTGSRSTGNRIPDACLRISDKKICGF